MRGVIKIIGETMVGLAIFGVLLAASWSAGGLIGNAIRNHVVRTAIGNPNCIIPENLAAMCAPCTMRDRDCDTHLTRCLEVDAHGCCETVETACKADAGKGVSL